MSSEPLTDAEAKLRNIVSHATGGSSQDAQASLNDICVRISQHHNRVWEKAQEVARKESADRIASLEAEVAALREGLARLVQIADYMPKETPAAGGCSTVHKFDIEAGTIWSLDERANEARALLSRGDGNG